MQDSRHVTLTANTVTTVTLGAEYAHLEVVNVDGVAAVYFTIDGTAPTIAGNGTTVLPAAISGVEIDTPESVGTTVKLISSGTPKVSVRGW